MEPQNVIIKFEDAAEQAQGPVKRIVGFVKAKYLVGLIDSADLQANPRSAKVGNVTDDIIDSIEQSADIFPFKTKGILLGTSAYTALERQRYELNFGDPEVEGVLDGGHNMLAIALEILKQATDEEEKPLKRVKTWADLKEAWAANRKEVDKVRPELDFLVPIEVLVPSDLEDEMVVEEFRTSLLDICAARNNNVQLTLETKANKKGFYEEIKSALPASVSKHVEWKSNDGGRFKVRDLVALSWIPLNFAKDQGLLPSDVKGVTPQNIYRNKGACSKAFDDLMGHAEVSTKTGGYTHELKNPAVGSAFEILGDLPQLYDLIYEQFPELYNRVGSFGRISVVKMYDPNKKRDGKGKYIATQPTTPFFGKKVRYRYPEGLIMPLVYGLKALLTVEGGRVQWKVHPGEFLQRNLGSIVEAYKVVLEMGGYDPQKIGKNEGTYQLIVNAYKQALLTEGVSGVAAL